MLSLLCSWDGWCGQWPPLGRADPCGSFQPVLLGAGSRPHRPRCATNSGASGRTAQGGSPCPEPLWPECCSCARLLPVLVVVGAPPGDGHGGAGLVNVLAQV